MRRIDDMPLRRGLHAAMVICLALVLSGCASLGASGPSAGTIAKAGQRDARVRVVALTDDVARSVVSASARETLSERLGDMASRHDAIGVGDVLDVSIWEAPPAVLFTSGFGNPSQVGASATASFPAQMVDSSGAISIPFAGRVMAAGRTPAELARDIQGRLDGKAHSPQVLVRISQNQSAVVTVVGEVASSRQVPLTTRSERLLDALAAAGGARQPVDKVLVQVTRGSIVATRPLGAIIRDPAENVYLVPGDVVTVLFQPYSFQALGAFGVNAEVPFEGTGITLAQAIGRVGGLQDNRANIRGLFIFRLEDPKAIPEQQRLGAPLTPDGKVPVIYSIDMGNPATFFLIQNFPMRDKDILYVSNAPAVDLQKFVGLVSQMTFSVVGVVSAVP